MPPRKAVFSEYQSHIFHLATVLGAGGDDINSRCVYTAVTKNISELGNVFLYAVKHASEQVAEIVRKDLIRIDARLFAKILHLTPDVRAAHRLAGFRDENLSRGDSMPLTI